MLLLLFNLTDTQRRLFIHRRKGEAILRLHLSQYFCLSLHRLSSSAPWEATLAVASRYSVSITASKPPGLLMKTHPHIVLPLHKPRPPPTPPAALFSSTPTEHARDPPPFPPNPYLLQGLSAGQQGLLQLANAALQLVDLLVALLQLAAPLLGAEQQLTAPIRLLLQLRGQLFHLAEAEREETGSEREREQRREGGC